MSGGEPAAALPAAGGQPVDVSGDWRGCEAVCGDADAVCGEAVEALRLRCGAEPMWGEAEARPSCACAELAPPSGTSGTTGGGSGALAGLATIGLGSSVVVVGTAMVVIAEAWGAKGESARALGDAGVVCG